MYAAKAFGTAKALSNKSVCAGGVMLPVIVPGKIPFSVGNSLVLALEKMIFQHKSRKECGTMCLSSNYGVSPGTLQEEGTRLECMGLVNPARAQCTLITDCGREEIACEISGLLGCELKSHF